MLAIKGDSAPAALAGVFWDPFHVARAIRDLVGGGFSEDEIDAIGVLYGPAPGFTEWLFSMKLDRQEAVFFRECLTDRAVLLIVRTERGHRAGIALKTLRRHRCIVRLGQEHYECR